MKIDNIAVFRVNMPLVYPFRTAFGNDAEIESILVRLDSGSVSGWGEATPWRSPGYSGEFAEGAHLCIRKFLAPRVVGRDIESGEELQQILSPVKANYCAKAAIDAAWWDLYSRLNGLPLWKALGGKSPTVTVGADFGVMESIGELIDKISGAVEAGYQRVKLKYRPGWELEMVEAVRRHFPDLPMHVDCNSAYRLSDTEMFVRLDDYDLVMIEQPLAHDDLYDHSVLARKLRTPICLDESVTSPDRARQAIEMGACRWVNVKPGRVGGLTPAKQLLAECARRGVPCWIGGMLESALGAAQCLALATLPNIEYPNDVFPSERFYTKDLCTPPMALSGPSTMTAGDEPGTGAEPLPERLSECTVEQAELSA